jgi:hypothetical protein
MRRDSPPALITRVSKAVFMVDFSCSVQSM